MRILVLSPHTDDAELGAGGSIIRLLEEGHEIYWIVFSSAEESLPEGMAPDTLKAEFQDVISEFGIKDYKIFDFKVRYLFEQRQTILEEMIKLKDRFRPSLVITPSSYDHHQDHQVVNSESIRAFKNSSSIIGYELPWNHTQFVNPLLIRLEDRHIAKKWEILNKYKSQITLKKQYFNKEFIYGVASIRGSQCSRKYAESFQVIRWIM